MTSDATDGRKEREREAGRGHWGSATPAHRGPHCCSGLSVCLPATFFPVPFSREQGGSSQAPGVDVEAQRVRGKGRQGQSQRDSDSGQGDRDSGEGPSARRGQGDSGSETAGPWQGDRDSGQGPAASAADDRRDCCSAVASARASLTRCLFVSVCAAHCSLCPLLPLLPLLPPSFTPPPLAAPLPPSRRRRRARSRTCSTSAKQRQRRSEGETLRAGCPTGRSARPPVISTDC